MAIALSEERYGEAMIQFLGRWRSTAFMDYIRPEVMEMTCDVASGMVDHTITDLNDDHIAVLQLDF